MKNLLTTLFFVLIALTMATGFSYAQAPEGIIYQAEARNELGQLISNEMLDVKISILKESTDGLKVWEGTHKVVTNQYGMFIVVVGTGEHSPAYNFMIIQWDEFPHFLNVKVKAPGSAEWIDMGTSQFLSVPYALHAKTAESLVSPQLKGASKTGVPSQTWSLFGNLGTDPEKDFLGTTDPADLVIITDNTERLRIMGDGNVVLKNNLEIGNDLTVKYNASLNTMGGHTMNYGPFTVAGGSTALLTGPLNVEGATNLNGILNVNNGNKTHLTGDLQVDGNLGVDGTTTLGNLDLTGTLDVAGAATLKNTLEVSSATTLNSTLAANGQVTINFNNLTGDAASYDEYALRVEGSKHGIGIKSTMAIPSRQDNFITFFDNSGSAKGRIEGNSGLPGLVTSVIYQILEPDPITLDDINNLVLHGTLPNTPISASGDQSSTQPLDIEADGIDWTSEYAVELYGIGVSFTKSVIVFGVNVVGALVGAAAFGDIDDVVWSGVDVIAESIQWGIFEIFNTLGLGVAFESGGADYAEWLEKKDVNELLTFGDVVGIRGGVISKEFKRAEKYMVITQNPTVIGAMPEEGDEKKYEKVAFMGQVAVKVIGKVKKGDYILPSGNQDGMAIAVSPEKMAVGDYARIIGTAWSESDGKELFSFINTAVGINSNDLVRVIEDMQGMLNDMQLAIAEINPDYTPQLYAMSGNAGYNANPITTSPSVNMLMAQKSGAMQAKTVEEAIIRIKDYAYMNNPNLDLSKFPYLTEMFENPTLETAEAMLEHYKGVLNKLTALVPPAQN